MTLIYVNEAKIDKKSIYILIDNKTSSYAINLLHRSQTPYPIILGRFLKVVDISEVLYAFKRSPFADYLLSYFCCNEELEEKYFDIERQLIFEKKDLANELEILTKRWLNEHYNNFMNRKFDVQEKVKLKPGVYMFHLTHMKKVKSRALRNLLPQSRSPYRTLLFFLNR